MYRCRDCVNNAYVGQRTRGLAERGMRVQGVTIINPDFRLYKFVQSSTSRDEDLIRSPWWFQAPEIRNILNDARYQSGGISLPSEQARQNAGISSTWAGAGTNYILAVRTFAPVRAYWGPPRPIGAHTGSAGVSGIAPDKDVAHIEIVPDTSCVQFFIPGTRQIAGRFLTVQSRTKLDNNALLRSGDLEGFINEISRRG